jgi:1,4-alpha-glucan branching enzyme
MIKREQAKDKGQVKVTFVIPHNPEQPRTYVVGDFNDWNMSATPLVKRANNTRSASVTLEPDRRYSFRYYTEDGQWFNDDQADAYEPGAHGSDNCIIMT